MSFTQSGYSDLFNLEVTDSDNVTINASLTLPFLTPSLLVGTDANNKLQSLITASSNGVTAFLVGNVFGIDTPQSVQSTSNISFNSVTLQTLGGTPTQLNYYEEYLHASTWSGPIPTTSNLSTFIVRIGKNVTISPSVVIGIGNSISATLKTDIAIPSRFCPSVSMGFDGAWTIENSQNTHGGFNISSTGILSFTQEFSSNYSANTGVNGTGIRQSFSYCLV
jgi:hypothetical protein